jgi:hypothetical protein
MQALNDSAETAALLLRSGIRRRHDLETERSAGVLENVDLDERRIGRAERLRYDEIGNAGSRNERDGLEGHSRNEKVDPERPDGDERTGQQHGADERDCAKRYRVDSHRLSARPQCGRRLQYV